MQRALGRVQWVWGFLSGVFWGECIQALLSLPHGFSLCSWPCCIHAHRRSQRKGEDRRGPALDLLWISKAFMKSPLHVIPTPAPPPPGRFSLNTHLTFHNFLHFSRTRGNIQQDRPQDRLVTKGTRWPKWGQQKLLAPQVWGWWLCAQGRSQLEHLRNHTPLRILTCRHCYFCFLCLSAISPPLSGFCCPGYHCAHRSPPKTSAFSGGAVWSTIHRKKH